MLEPNSAIGIDELKQLIANDKVETVEVKHA